MKAIIEESVDLRFAPQLAQPAPSNTETAAAHKPMTIRPSLLVDGKLDLGAIATEFLLLGIDPYPRKRRSRVRAGQGRRCQRKTVRGPGSAEKAPRRRLAGSRRVQGDEANRRTGLFAAAERLWSRPFVHSQRPRCRHAPLTPPRAIHAG